MFMRRVAVLLVEGDDERRSHLSRALRAEGMPVTAVSGIAEVERWPAGDVVVTESRRFTTLWKETGAMHVVVLADTDEDGIDACIRGASVWVPRDAHADTLIGVLHDLGVFEPAMSENDEA
jgi:CheY-like chemotaxis protein